MENERRFEPIASRDLLLVRADGMEIPIHVAIGAPYPLVRVEGSECSAGCLVLTCDDPDLASEVVGSDLMEALAVALSFLELYLIKIVEETDGVLQNADGSAFRPDGSIFLREARRFVSRKVDRA
jgi:hypothetical protein